jgi:hypothetical protein
MAERAQVKDEQDTTPRRHRHRTWAGALRGEYSAAQGQWGFFCPVWHTGQAVKAWAGAFRLTEDARWLDAARRGAEFIARNQVDDSHNDDDGLILAYEDEPDKVNTSAILECLDGWLELDAVTGEGRYAARFARAVDWVARKAWLRGEGLFLDLYDPAAKAFVPHAYGAKGRPLLDDGIFLKAQRATGRSEFAGTFLETANRLLADESPAGNWVCYRPCNAATGSIHPRHAYWWGYPMFLAYDLSGEARYLDCALRACRWYAQAQRRDGGLFRGTYIDFNTDSFGHATSGLACALTMWAEADARTGKNEFTDCLARGLKYCLSLQFTEVRDENLKGAILEKVLPPNGSDRLPYHIRDLGTIFFVQAVARLLGG